MEPRARVLVRILAMLLGAGGASAASRPGSPMVAPPAWVPPGPDPGPRLLVRMQRARLAPDGTRRIQHYRLVRAGLQGGFGDPVSLLYRPAQGSARVVLARTLGPGPSRVLAGRETTVGSGVERCLEVDPGPGRPGELLEVVLEEAQGSPPLGTEDFAPGHWFGTEEGVDLDLFEAAVPAGIELRYLARGMGGASAPTVRIEAGERVLAWALRTVRARKGSPRPYVRTSTLASWAPVRGWFAPRLKRRLAGGPGVQDAARALAPRTAGEGEVVAAAWKRVAQGLAADGSIRDGAEAVLGRPADVVLAGGTGNCADKANLFCALLAARGIRASPVIVARGGHRTLDPQLPTYVPGDHALARLWVAGQARWCDPSDATTGWPDLAPGLVGRLAWDPISGTFQRIEKPPRVRPPIAEPGAG